MFGAYNSGIDPQDDPFHPFTPDEWSQQTTTMLRTYLIQNLPDPHGPEPVPSGPISSSRPTDMFFNQKLRSCSCGTKPQHSRNHWCQ